MCAVGRIHNGLKVVFYFMHASPSHYHHYAYFLTCIDHTRWKILEAWVNGCCVYSVESVSKMQLVLLVTLLIFFAICGVVCDKLVHSSLGDREDVFITHFTIFIKSQVSTFVVIFSVVVCLRLSQFSQSSFMQYMGLCIISWPIPLMLIVRIHVLYLIIIIKTKVWHICHCYYG